VVWAKQQREGIQSGQLAADRVRHHHLSPEKALEQQQPYCTHSQTIDYVEGQIRVAVVHQYLASDGVSLGGSGMPDPKCLEFNRVIYAGWIRDTWYKKGYWVLGWISGIRYRLLG
jgi:hypothetical protein